MTSTMRGGASQSLPVILCCLIAATSTLAHADESESMHSHGATVDEATMRNATEYPSTYFSHTEYVGTIYAHIALMIIAWVFILPVAVMLSIARSRYTLAIQFTFTAVNAISIVLATVYNNNTPDLYPNNAHHKIGWIATWIMFAHILVNLAGRVAKAYNSDTHTDYSKLHPTLPSSESISTFYSRSSSQNAECRISDDSGHWSASPPSSIHNDYVSTLCAEEADSRDSHSSEYGNGNDKFENLPLASKKHSMVWTKVAQLVSCSIWKYVDVGYKVVDRIILPFGFVALATGFITFARFFEGRAIFGGLAHWIKGGVFFWLGLFNLGRWSGSFAELGWAWNLRPKPDSQRKHRMYPPAELVESALILFYGSTNIFLEHLGGWGGEWTAQDLEHMAITVLFIGGGLCGILIESTRIRDLLNTTITVMPTNSYADEEKEQLEEPEAYEFSLNPIPALVILLLGIMMSSHHQETMTATMVHKQWGTLLLWASVARGLTYVLFYIKPPRSIFPSRPPTELLASFGLIAGGLIFMASSSDTVSGMIHYDLDAMFLYTVTMGLVGMLMAWELVVLAIKGFAVRAELAGAS